MPKLELGLPIEADDLGAELPPDILLRERVQKYFEFDTTGTSFYSY